MDEALSSQSLKPRHKRTAPSTACKKNIETILGRIKLAGLPEALRNYLCQQIDTAATKEEKRAAIALALKVLDPPSSR